MGFGEEVKMANLNWGNKGTLIILGIKKLRTSLELISATKEQKYTSV